MKIVLEKKKKKKKKKKPDFKKEKKSGLHGWFSRQGGKGSSQGWVDCNTCRKNKKTGRKTCKSCGRKKGEKRAKYPSCRPKPSDCGSSGKGKEWGKKKESIEMKISKEKLLEMIEEEITSYLEEKEEKKKGKYDDGDGKDEKCDYVDCDDKDEKEDKKKTKKISEGLNYHLDNNLPLSENIYRIGSEEYFKLYSEARSLHKERKINLSQEDASFINETEIGEFALFEGEMVPLDFPMYIQEKKKKKKKDPPIGKPTKNTGSGKKYKVYVRNPKTGNVKKITYGDAKGGLKGNWNNPEARKSFAARHNCEDKKDRTKSGYWACRAHKDFGKNVPGRFW